MLSDIFGGFLTGFWGVTEIFVVVVTCYSREHPILAASIPLHPWIITAPSA
jgi:hypothetical protein